jgi:hypothetical protein
VLMIASETEIERLHKSIVDEFQWVTIEVGGKQSYLGM